MIWDRISKISLVGWQDPGSSTKMTIEIWEIVKWNHMKHERARNSWKQ